jgi:hypothetical protein
MLCTFSVFHSSFFNCLKQAATCNSITTFFYHFWGLWGTMYEHDTFSFCFFSKECLANNLQNNSRSGIEQHYHMEIIVYTTVVLMIVYPYTKHSTPQDAFRGVEKKYITTWIPSTYVLEFPLFLFSVAPMWCLFENLEAYNSYSLHDYIMCALCCGIARMWSASFLLYHLSDFLIGHNKFCFVTSCQYKHLGANFSD